MTAKAATFPDINIRTVPSIWDGAPSVIVTTLYGNVRITAQNDHMLYFQTDPRDYAHSASVGDKPDGRDAGLTHRTKTTGAETGPLYVTAHLDLAKRASGELQPDAHGLPHRRDGWYVPSVRIATVPIASEPGKRVREDVLAELARVGEIWASCRNPAGANRSESIMDVAGRAANLRRSREISAMADDCETLAKELRRMAQDLIAPGAKFTGAFPTDDTARIVAASYELSSLRSTGSLRSMLSDALTAVRK